MVYHSHRAVAVSCRSIPWRQAGVMSTHVGACRMITASMEGGHSGSGAKHATDATREAAKIREVQRNRSLSRNNTVSDYIRVVMRNMRTDTKVDLVFARILFERVGDTY